MRRVAAMVIGLLTLSWWSIDLTRTYARRTARDETRPATSRSSSIARERQLLEAETNLKLSEAKLKEAEAKLRDAELQLERSKNLFQAGQATQDEVIQRERTLSAARAGIDTERVMLKKHSREMDLLREEFAAIEEDRLKAESNLAALDAELQQAAVALAKESKSLADAEEKVKQANALNEQARIRSAQAQLDAARASVEKARLHFKFRESQLQVMKDSTGKRVTVDFPEVAPGTLVLNTLFSAANVSYVIDSSVKTESISLKLVDVPFDKALNIVTEALGLQYSVKDGVYFIRPRSGRHDVGSLQGTTRTFVTGPEGEHARHHAIKPGDVRLLTVLEGSPLLTISDPMVAGVKTHPDRVIGSRVTFACPYCKKKESVLPGEGAGGVRRYCPFCGKKLPARRAETERVISGSHPEIARKQMIEAEKAVDAVKAQLENLRVDLPRVLESTELPQIQKQIAIELPKEIQKQLAVELPKVQKQFAIELPRIQKEIAIELPKVQTQIRLELAKAQLVEPANLDTIITKVQEVTRHSKFICPHCKKKETITHTDKSAKGRWRYCPFCGKRVK